MVWRAFLWLLAGYFAVIGLVQAAAWVVGILFPPKVPKGCRLILAVEEDADYTESGLHGCCRRYCRDRNIETLELLPPEKWCMIEKIEERGKPLSPAGKTAGWQEGGPQAG